MIRSSENLSPETTINSFDTSPDIGEIEKKKSPKTYQQKTRKTKGPSKQEPKSQKASEQNSASPPEPISQPPSQLVKGVAAIYQQLDFFRPLHEIIQQVQNTLGEQLIHPAHAFWVFTDLAFQGFHPQACFVATASTAMETVKKLHDDLSTVITNPPEHIDSKSQATDFIRTNFPHNEISLKNLALLASRTILSEVERASAYTNCSLVLFQEGMQARKSSRTTRMEESPVPNRETSQEQKTEESICPFADKVAQYCREMDFSKEFETLRAAVEKHLDRKLSSESDRLFLYTEMAFQCFHANRQRIAMASTAMTAATSTYKKLTTALSTPKGITYIEGIPLNGLTVIFPQASSPLQN